MSIRVVASCVAITGLWVCAHAADVNRGVETTFVVTVADHMGHKPPVLTKEDLNGSLSMRIKGVTPLYGDKELYILVDDAANYDFGAKLDELRTFVKSQPQSTAVGLAFIRDGELNVIQTPAKDRQLVARALRAPSGSKPANPYCALFRLLSGWKPGVERREILMITSGLDNSPAGAAFCGNADSAIAEAERIGVSVYAIYHPSADYAAEDWRRVDNGVVDLSHVCYETGGESYFVTHSAMETIAPFLDDISEHLDNQYRVTAVFDAAALPGLRDVYLHPVSLDLELMAPAKVWIGGEER